MKEIEINGKKYPLYIGLDFIRELDKKYTHKFGEIEFGFGIGKLLLNLSQYNPIAIVDFVMAATNTLDAQPSDYDFEKQFEKWESKEVVTICENFMDTLEKNSLTAPQIAQLGVVASLI